jgi:hypothetical protein
MLDCLWRTYMQAYTQQWLANTTRELVHLSEVGVSGVSLDVEHFHSKNISQARQAFSKLVCNLQSSLAQHHLSLHSVCTKIWGDTTLDLVGLSHCAEYLLPMAYDMIISKGPVASSNAPLPEIRDDLQRCEELRFRRLTSWPVSNPNPVSCDLLAGIICPLVFRLGKSCLGCHFMAIRFPARRWILLVWRLKPRTAYTRVFPRHPPVAYRLRTRSQLGRWGWGQFLRSKPQDSQAILAETQYHSHRFLNSWRHDTSRLGGGRCGSKMQPRWH